MDITDSRLWVGGGISIMTNICDSLETAMREEGDGRAETKKGLHLI